MGMGVRVSVMLRDCMLVWGCLVGVGKFVAMGFLSRRLGSFVIRGIRCFWMDVMIIVRWLRVGNATKQQGTSRSASLYAEMASGLEHKDSIPDSVVMTVILPVKMAVPPAARSRKAPDA